MTPVLRGCVYESVKRTASPKVEDQFGFAEIHVVSFADLYAGKLVAALDRQHPRDLFDVRDLLTNEGIDDKLRKAFVVYVLSHNRPMSELLAPAHLDIAHEFARGFDGMAEKPVTLEDLYKDARRAHRRACRQDVRGAPAVPGLLRGRQAGLGASRPSCRGETSSSAMASAESRKDCIEEARRTR